jgi:hypothetical protein
MCYLNNKREIKLNAALRLARWTSAQWSVHVVLICALQIVFIVVRVVLLTDSDMPGV